MNDIITALTLELAARKAKGDTCPNSPVHAHFELTHALAHVTEQVADSCIDTPRTAQALLGLAATALQFIDAFGAELADLIPPTCWYCDHARTSTRDCGVYCAELRIHKPDASICTTGHYTRRSTT